LRNGLLFSLAIRIGLLFGLLFCMYTGARRGIGDWYFRKESPTSIQAAIKYDGDNPQYYDALGTLTHFYGNTRDLDASVAFYEKATRLSPYDAHFWSDLGAAYDWAGRTNDALGAFALFTSFGSGAMPQPIEVKGQSEQQGLPHLYGKRRPGALAESLRLITEKTVSTLARGPYTCRGKARYI
jgi:hypothetical protein